MTNEKLVKQIMNFSQFGVLSQIMIMQAINHYVDLVIKQEKELIDEYEEMIKNKRNPLVNAHAWVGVAKEIKDKIDNNNK